MAGYAKLFSDIVHSTVWREGVYTKVVWITMLAMSDKHGLVMASVPGLADMAKVTLDQCVEAIKILSSPDEYSRTKDYEGRRISEVDGGWLLLNYEKFRLRKDDEEQRIATAERVRRHRAREAAKNSVVTESVTVTSGNAPKLHTDTDTSSSTDLKDQELMSGKPDAEQVKTTKNKEQNKIALEVLTFLNQKAGRNYRDVPANINLIVSRLKEGFTSAEMYQVIAMKCREWVGDPVWAKHLCPDTLFNRTKFAKYAGQLIKQEPKP